MSESYTSPEKSQEDRYLDRLVCWRYGHEAHRRFLRGLDDWVTTCWRCGLFQPDDDARYQRRINALLGFEPGPLPHEKPP